MLLCVLPSWFSLSLPGSASPFPPRSVTLSSSSFPSQCSMKLRFLKAHAGILSFFEGKLLFLPEQTASFFLRHRAPFLFLPCCECRGLAVSSAWLRTFTSQDVLWSTSVLVTVPQPHHSAASSSVLVSVLGGETQGCDRGSSSAGARAPAWPHSAPSSQGCV